MPDSESTEPPRSITVALFELGSLVATPGVLSEISQEEIMASLTRHLAGDWGELDEHDRNANDTALEAKGRLVSVYTCANGTRFYIITEWDRSVTTVLLPEEY